MINFRKSFPALKIYMSLIGLGIVFNLWGSITNISGEEYIKSSEISYFFFVISFIGVIVFKFIVSDSLVKIKNDVAGGLKEIGKVLKILAFIDVGIAFVFVLLLLYIVVGGNFNDSSPNNSPEDIVFNAIIAFVSITFSIIVIYLIYKALKKGELYNLKNIEEKN